MPVPPGDWKASVESADDPLAAYHLKPVISSGGPNATYLGRIVIELWDTPEARDDAYRIAMTSEEVDGKHADLLARLAAALPTVIQRRIIQNP
jgi:hypothetical protein